MTDWTRFEPEALEGRTAHAHTVEGTCVTGRLARVAGPIDQLVFEGVLQPPDQFGDPAPAGRDAARRGSGGGRPGVGILHAHCAASTGSGTGAAGTVGSTLTGRGSGWGASSVRAASPA